MSVLWVNGRLGEREEGKLPTEAWAKWGTQERLWATQESGELEAERMGSGDRWWKGTASVRIRADGGGHISPASSFEALAKVQKALE